MTHLPPDELGIPALAHSNRCRVRSNSRLATAWLGVWSTALGVACAEGRPAGEWTGTITDSAGVIVVVNPEQPLWAPGDEWRVAQDLVIGEADGDPDYMFAHITGICIGSAGQIFVVDDGSSSVREYAPDGALRSSFGGRGAGPGEMGAELGPCLMGRGDTLFIPDLQNFRVSRFTANGSSVPPVSFDVRDGVPVEWDVTPSGRLAAQLRFLGILTDAGEGTPDAIVVWSSDGAVSDTLLQFSSGDAVSMAPGSAHLTLLAGAPRWRLTSDGGVLYGFSDTYRITIHDTHGTPARVVTKSVLPLHVTGADREILRGVVEAAFDRGFLNLIELRFAESFPAFFDFHSGPNGTLWVQRIRPPSARTGEERERDGLGRVNAEVFLVNPRLPIGAPEWDVFDEEGRFLGTVLLPERFEPIRFVGDFIYGVWRDEADVEYVMRLAIETR